MCIDAQMLGDVLCIYAQMLGEIGVGYALTRTPMAAQPRAWDAA